MSNRPWRKCRNTCLLNRPRGSGAQDYQVAQVWGGLLRLTPDALPVCKRPGGIDGLVIGAGFEEADMDSAWDR
ncbi:MAG: hypothetical protein R2845_06565 [Thermomicrobiales bacterium]